jgi:hypothetical protein
MDTTPIHVSVEFQPHELGFGQRYVLVFHDFDGLGRFWHWHENKREFTLGVSDPPPPGSTRALTGNEENMIKSQNSASHGREKDNSTNQGRPVETVNMHELGDELVGAANKLLHLASITLPTVYINVLNEDEVSLLRVAELTAEADEIKLRLKRARLLYPTCPQMGATIAELKRQLAANARELTSIV